MTQWPGEQNTCYDSPQETDQSEYFSEQTLCRTKDNKKGQDGPKDEINIFH